MSDSLKQTRPEDERLIHPIEIKKISHLLLYEESPDNSREKSEKATGVKFPGYLEKLSGRELSDLRTKIEEAVLGEQTPIWEKLGQVTSFMPNFINARVAQSVLGPHLTANLTYHLPVKEAVAVAGHFSLEFLLEVSEHLIPSKAKGVIEALPLSTVKKLTAQMSKDKNYYLMGTFVDSISPERLLKISDVIDEDETLLRIAGYVENKVAMAPIVNGFGDEKILSLLRTAHRLELWEEIVSIARHLAQDERLRIAAIMEGLEAAALERARQVAGDLGLLDELESFFPSV